MPYVSYSSFQRYQHSLFRTVAMLLSMISLITVSILMNWLFKENNSQIFTRQVTFLNLYCVYKDPCCLRFFYFYSSSDDSQRRQLGLTVSGGSKRQQSVAATVRGDGIGRNKIVTKSYI